MRKHTISYQITRVHVMCGLVCNREFAGKLGQLSMKWYHMKGKKKRKYLCLITFLNLMGKATNPTEDEIHANQTYHCKFPFQRCQSC